MPTVGLTFEKSVSADNKVLTITDTTPVGVSTSGYNQTGGLQLGDVTSATLTGKFYFTDTTTYDIDVDLFPSTYNATPFIEGEGYVLEMDSFGGAAGDVFVDCVAHLIYTVNGTVSGDDVSYQAECFVLLAGNVCCCIDEKLAAMKVCDKADGLYTQYLNINGMSASANCGKIEQALDALSAVQKYCDNGCVNC